MKKSELYQTAMIAVVDSNLTADVKLEVLALLIDNKRVAEWSEKKEENIE